MLILGRNDPTSARVFDWATRNKLTGAVAVRYADTLKPGEYNWRAGAQIPALLTQRGGAPAWVSGEQAIKDAIWAARQPPVSPMVAYVSRTCGACQKFLMMLASSEKLLRDTDIKILDDSPENILAMHDFGITATPGLVVNDAPGGRKVLSGPAASQYIAMRA